MKKEFKGSVENRREKVKRHFAEAERGEDGLKRVPWHYFDYLPMNDIREQLDEPVVMTVDGIDACVVMRVEGYFAMRVLNPNPTRRPEMVRLRGKLFREVL